VIAFAYLVIDGARHRSPKRWRRDTDLTIEVMRR